MPESVTSNKGYLEVDEVLCYNIASPYVEEIQEEKSNNEDNEFNDNNELERLSSDAQIDEDVSQQQLIQFQLETEESYQMPNRVNQNDIDSFTIFFDQISIFSLVEPMA